MPCGTLCAVVNQRSWAPRLVSPVDVAMTCVLDPEAMSPLSEIPTWVWVEPVFVTMFCQRAQSLLCGTNTLRVSVRFCAPKVWVGKTSSWFVPFPSGQSSPASAWPVLKTRGDGSVVPFRLLMRSPLKPTKAGVSGTSTLNWVVKVLVPPNSVKTT